MPATMRQELVSVANVNATLVCTDAITAGLDFEQALQDPDMVKLQASQQVRIVVAVTPAASAPLRVAVSTSVLPRVPCLRDALL